MGSPCRPPHLILFDLLGGADPIDLANNPRAERSTHRARPDYLILSSFILHLLNVGHFCKVFNTPAVECFIAPVQASS
ncbi:hypothetical protein B0H14DRAFT_3431244 [Mycena olivaceomarginata]|nr:hypothetical protein B0H14DRAFT_3431244 [Mycena olivaceomarginata]